ncbi:class I SAM-dependent methyltransferase [Halorubrum ezzemoulense]|jgi:release factor glutamine methyltransferase|uniref:Methyltransferase n=2 Tax=Halorubrum ezzemoulense TaxID=337243 RepID=A0A256JK64_HALEZ|nr:MULTISPECIES: HemK2/MTQ2 family protein methyltransferase [Halorubrum]MDB2238138.1 class I SAM-dependent methyltransferase [Halorubrum ezzemoulense]MDB2247607.1 class I SAM-dependent methyltransferase [Halorubrum ezzemoulense]MDB2263951.1 class I SAM-dependent methyltransferase [Halorubrum ezzemoulense]MDB2269586.1 class I SAM-dependent methyltransferase [Halorubrum ezzemoulense]MDB2280943.1 class I SAM-dependent methyltransferase [Halorubrum ezzemoulense]
MTDDASEGDLAARRGLDDAVVYQPAEDSGLLAEAAVAEARGRVLEVGTGSGWVAARVASERDLDVVGSDLNPHAARQARDRGVGAVVADLLSPFRADAFDTVCFNPPYLPTDPENEWSDWMEHALSGGESGRELIEPFLADVGRVLAPGGVVLLLVSSLTGYEEVLALIEEAGFDHEVVVEESFPFETLTVLALRRA